MTVLFVTRKSRGIGGMQQMNADLWKGIQRHFPDKQSKSIAVHGVLMAALLPLRLIVAARGVTHVHFGDAVLLPLVWLLHMFNPRARVSVTVHGLDVMYPLWWYQRILCPALRSVDCVVCVSEATAKVVRERGVDQSRTSVIPCGVWKEDVMSKKKTSSADTSGPLLLSVGRLVKRKGIPWFIASVLPQLLHDFPGLQYRILGTGPEEKLIKKIVQEKGLADVVRVEGEVSDEERNIAWAEADLFVMPNRIFAGDMEGFGIVCVEASAHGLPVVAANIEGLLSSVRDGETGAHFREGDATDCAKKIAALLVSPLDRGTVSCVTESHFAWEKLMERYVSEVFVPLKKRIGVLTWDDRNAKGGLGRAMMWIADALRHDSADVRVFAPSEGRLSWTKRFPAGHLLFSLLLPFWLQRRIDRESIATVLLPVSPGGVFLLRKPKRVSLVAVAYHTYMQQSRSVPGQWWKRFLAPLERRTLHLAETVLCYSADTEQSLVNDYRVSGDRIIRLPQLLDLSAWVPKEPVQKEFGLCVCVARLEQRKGVATLLDAWEKVAAALPEARLVLVGTGVQQSLVRSSISAFGSSVRNVVSLPREELVALVQRATLVVCPSYLEGFGLSCAEAMAAGTTVVASDAPGLRNLIVDGETGRLFPAGDAAALSQQIIALVGDEETRRTLEERASSYAGSKFAEDSARTALQDSVCVSTV